MVYFYKILFLEVVSICILILGIRSSKNLKKKMTKMGKSKIYWYATLQEDNGIIIAGILGIIGGIVFLIRHFLG